MRMRYLDVEKGEKAKKRREEKYKTFSDVRSMRQGHEQK